ncbi:MAG: hypothetical protein ACI8PZ_006952 [Myxococcota bacterium]|jgi:hypothetical protein
MDWLVAVDVSESAEPLLTRLTSGGSSRLASRRTNTSGPSRTPVRPERQGCLNRMHTRPSSSTDRRCSDTAARAV